MYRNRWAGQGFLDLNHLSSICSGADTCWALSNIADGGKEEADRVFSCEAVLAKVRYLVYHDSQMVVGAVKSASSFTDLIDIPWSAFG